MTPGQAEFLFEFLLPQLESEQAVRLVSGARYPIFGRSIFRADPNNFPSILWQGAVPDLREILYGPGRFAYRGCMPGSLSRKPNDLLAMCFKA